VIKFIDRETTIGRRIETFGGRDTSFVDDVGDNNNFFGEEMRLTIDHRAA